MPGINLKITIDTNWLISCLIKQVPNFQIVLDSPLIIIYSSSEQFDEFNKKILDFKFRKYYEVDEALAFLQNFKILSTKITLTSIVDISLIPKTIIYFHFLKMPGQIF